MLKKTGLSLLLILLTACAEQPFKEYEEIALENKELKIEAPEFHPYVVKGLETVECENGLCTMTEEDFRQNQTDKWNLLQIYKLNHKKDVIRVEAFNTLVDAHSHSEAALSKKNAALYHLEQELRREKTYNAFKTWMDRLLFIGGVALFGAL
jgi:major membrane immunogen (membrane-anchored lipoprotein)